MVFFALYAVGWRAMLRPFDLAGRAGFGYVLWVTMVREAVDRLLPVASVGGSVIGVRLIRWRGLATIPVSATVIVEILLTLFALYLFGALATLILLSADTGVSHRQVVAVLVASLPIPVGSLAVVAIRLRVPAAAALPQTDGRTHRGAEAAAVAGYCPARLSRAACTLLIAAGALQFVALVSAAFEIWWALRLFDHPVSVASSVMLEGLTQAVRHLAFIVPAGLGVQEAALVLFGHALGISAELALAVSAVKRMREVLCGVPPLLSWQWLEARSPRRGPCSICNCCPPDIAAIAIHNCSGTLPNCAWPVYFAGQSCRPPNASQVIGVDQIIDAHDGPTIGRRGHWRDCWSSLIGLGALLSDSLKLQQPRILNVHLLFGVVLLAVVARCLVNEARSSAAGLRRSSSICIRASSPGRFTFCCT